MSGPWKTPPFVAHDRPATADEYYRLNRAVLIDPNHPRHAEASSDWRALTFDEVRRAGGDPLAGVENGVVHG